MGHKNRPLHKERLKKKSSTSSTTPFIDPRTITEPELDEIFADMGVSNPRKKRSLLYDIEAQTPLPTLAEIKKMTDPKQQQKALKKWKKKKKKREEEEEREKIVWSRYEYCNIMDNPLFEIFIFFVAMGTVAFMIVYLR